VKLTCRARGVPPPRVLWRREDSKGIIIREPAGSALNQKSHAENLTLVFYSRLRPILNRLAVWHTNTSRFNEPYTSRHPPHPPHPHPPNPHPLHPPHPPPLRPLHPSSSSHPPPCTPSQRQVSAEIHGEELKLTTISRTEMGVYLCIASNGVPPAISKRISINVHFPPAIHVPNQLVGAPLGTDVVLECNVEASPMSINYWIKDGTMLITSMQHIVEIFEKSSFQVRMTLLIKNLQKDNVGTYHCAAKNSLGEVDSTIRLYEQMCSDLASTREDIEFSARKCWIASFSERVIKD
ncbi:hypothetical protein M0802_011883, partial [Mischocyttarus mexicanus]